MIGRTAQIAVLVFIVALMLHLFIFGYVGFDEPRNFYAVDSHGYVSIGMNLMRHSVFSSSQSSPFIPNLTRTPVYPFVLAIVFRVFGKQEIAVIVLQMLLSSLTASLTFLIADKLQFPTLASLIASFLVALDPTSVLHAHVLLTETLFTTVLVTFIWVLVHYWHTRRVHWLLLSSVVLAIATLTRPISLFLGFVLLPLFFMNAVQNGKQKWIRTVLARGLLFIFVYSVLVFVWVYRNYHVSDMITVSTISKTNLLYYRAADVLSEAENTSLEAAREIIQTEVEHVTAQEHLTPDEQADFEQKFALKIFLQYPFHTVMIIVKGIGRMLVGPGIATVCMFLDPANVSHKCSLGFWGMSIFQQATIVGQLVILGILYFGGLIGVMYLISQRRWWELYLLLITIIYFVLISAGPEAYSRFRIPIVPFLAILAGVGYEAILARWQRRSILRSTPDADFPGKIAR